MGAGHVIEVLLTFRGVDARFIGVFLRVTRLLVVDLFVPVCLLVVDLRVLRRTTPAADLRRIVLVLGAAALRTLDRAPDIRLRTTLRLAGDCPVLDLLVVERLRTVLTAVFLTAERLRTVLALGILVVERIRETLPLVLLVDLRRIRRTRGFDDARVVDALRILRVRGFDDERVAIFKGLRLPDLLRLGAGPQWAIIFADDAERRALVTGPALLERVTRGVVRLRV